jgi:hypothetical protein
LLLLAGGLASMLAEKGRPEIAERDCYVHKNPSEKIYVHH